MDHVRAAGDDGFDLVAEAAEIRREDGRCDFDLRLQRNWPF